MRYWYWFVDLWRTQQFGGLRSSQWPQVRKEVLQEHPNCEVCGTNKSLAVHHCTPFNTRPELELLKSNLLVLCESAGMQCHITFGHLGNYKFYNPNVRADVEMWQTKVAQRLPNTPSTRQPKSSPI